VATLAAYARMMERDRKREGLRVCRAAWLSESASASIEIVAGDCVPSLDVYERASAPRRIGSVRTGGRTRLVVGDPSGLADTRAGRHSSRERQEFSRPPVQAITVKLPEMEPSRD
jgi:hypothetical protein